MESLSATASIEAKVDANMGRPTLIDDTMYHAMYEASIRSPESFWGKEGERIDWI